MVQPLVNIKNISMKYQSLNGEIDAIRDVSFDVSHGEFLSIVGPSGCGKSTLLSIISGLLMPTGGTVWLDGEEVSGTSFKVGFMPQKDHLFDWRTISQNVMLGLEIRGMMHKENTDYVMSLLKTYGLYDFKDKYPSQLSGGMRQRAALIRTLAVRPEILLLDEAFSALDYQTRLAVTDDIYTIIKNEHKTAIMVTHDIAESISMSDRVVVLSKRPAVVTAIHDIRFDIPERKPLACREAPEFPHYFNTIWKELDVHV
jgi:NitT/TauT family transport system ATP-binding protein